MNTIKVVGIDLAKSAFQLCVWMDDGTVAWTRKVSRSKLLDTVRQFPSDTKLVQPRITGGGLFNPWDTPSGSFQPNM